MGWNGDIGDFWSSAACGAIRQFDQAQARRNSPEYATLRPPSHFDPTRLSYRHAFHAGNHADVLKHFLLIQLSHYLGQKDKPFWIIDTHAGAGLYELDTGYAT